MAKLKGPLFSLDARGALAKLLTFRRHDRATIAGAPTTHGDARSPAQLGWRTMYEACSALWHTLSDVEKQTWESNARAKHMTGFALWQSQCLRPNPGIYLPLAGGTMSGDILMASHKITGLPAPTLDPDAATKAYVDASGGPPDYPKSLKSPVASYVMPGWFYTTAVGRYATANKIYYIPIFVAQTTIYTTIGIDVINQVAGTADLRIFNWTDGLPSTLILSAGTVDTGSPGVKEIIISQQLTRGYYFLAIRCTAAPRLQALDPDYGGTPPVQGIARSTGASTQNAILSVPADYSDPAPAPTEIETIQYAFVYLKET